MKHLAAPPQPATQLESPQSRQCKAHRAIADNGTLLATGGVRKGGVAKGKGASLLMIGKQSKTRPIAVGCVPAQPTAKQSVPHHLLARPISCQQQLGGVGQQVAVGAEKGDKITQREKGGAKASQRAKEKPQHHKAAHQAVVR